MLLTVSALTCTEEMIIGVAGKLLSRTAFLHSHTLPDGTLLTNKKYKDMLETYDYRVERVKDFVRLINPKIKITCVKLSDAWG